LSKDPKVSVVIATHNHAHFLPECLASVKKQTYTDYEVIVVNNGSTDNTEQVVKGLAWDKLRYYYQADTGSVAGPRNTGIRQARGEYIAFLDSDDLWYEEKLKQSMMIFERNIMTDVVSHDLYYVKNGTRKFIIKSGPCAPNMFKMLLRKNCVLGSATVVKKSVMLEIGGFDESSNFVHVEDYETWLRIAYLKKNFKFINEPLGEFHAHNSNLSLDFERFTANIINVIEKHFNQLKGEHYILKKLLYRNRLCTIYFDLGVQYFFRRKSRLFIKNIFQAFVLDPLCFIKNSFFLLSKLK
jgi:glycosyltransferase involved in cell wall biosynthesis